MGTKSTKKNEVAAPTPTKAPPKRKVAVRPGLTRTRKPAAATTKPERASKAEVPVAPMTSASEVLEIPTEMVAMRAYYLAETRQAKGEPGDSLTDWLEAERQLRAESRS